MTDYIGLACCTSARVTKPGAGFPSFSVHCIILHNKRCECAWCSTFSIHCIIPNIAANLSSVSFYFRGSFTNHSFRALIVCSILICLWPLSFCIALHSAHPEKNSIIQCAVWRKPGIKYVLVFHRGFHFLPMLQKKKEKRGECESVQNLHHRNRKTQQKMVAELLTYHYQAQFCNIQPSPHSTSSPYFSHLRLLATTTAAAAASPSSLLVSWQALGFQQRKRALIKTVPAVIFLGSKFLHN